LDAASSLGYHQTKVPLPLATIRKTPANRFDNNLKNLMKACAAKALAMLVTTARLYLDDTVLQR